MYLLVNALVLIVAVFLIILVGRLSYLRGKASFIQAPTRDHEMSPKEFQDFINTIVEANKPKMNLSDAEFIELVKENLEGKHDIDPKLGDDGFVDVSTECEGYECAASPNREDCCHSMGSDGRCHFVININQLCGVEDISKNPQLLTQEEINLLADAIKKFEESKEK